MSSANSSNCITQVKLELKTVIENLKLLEDTQITDGHQLKDLKYKTEQLLMSLENKPLESISLRLKKTRKRRLNKKRLKRQRQVVVKQEKEELQYPDFVEDIEHKPTISNIKINKPLERSRKYHNHLKSLHECQRFLKTFELLEQLHLARGQDPSETRKFSSKLQHLKLVWNCMLQEKQSEQSNNEQQVQQQWNQVLFGMTEKSYLEGKPNMKYFLRKRHIWDSYIDNKYGTSIPIGWVLPPMKPNNEWSKYLAN